MVLEKEFSDLCLACRIGDEESADRLLSLGVDANQNDEFNYSPLYLASLCGHENVVRLLLQRGAVCDTEKYEGVRCIYGALTDSIRNLLVSYGVSTSVDTNQPFASHIRTLLNGGIIGETLDEADVILTEDIVFKVKDSSIRLHRFMLICRSEYFREKLQNDWKSKNVIELNDLDDIQAFSNVVDYIYLRPEPGKLDNIDHETLIAYTRKLKLEAYSTFLEQYYNLNDIKEKLKIFNKFQLTILEEARTDLKAFVEDEIISKKLTLLTKSSINDKEIKTLVDLPCSPDIILSIEDENDGIVVYYPLHRSILIRDEYFKVMFSSSFSEAQNYEINPDYNIVNKPDRVPVIHLPVLSVEIAEIIIKYLYFDHADISLENALEVLFAGDLLLNDRLKLMAAVTITTADTIPDTEELFEILRAGWETRVDRLEHYVAKVIAKDLNKYLKDPQFAEIILESSSRIEVRQETDTIELIDDIRFYLAKKWNIDFDGLFEGEKNDHIDQLPGYEFYQQELNNVEDLLRDLQLDA